MYRILDDLGIGNVFILLSCIKDPLVPVYMKKKSEFIQFSNLNIVEEDDPNLPDLPITPGIILNNTTSKFIHTNMRARVQIAPNILTDQHISLLYGVDLGISIRTFPEEDINPVKKVPLENHYKLIQDNPNSKIFIASDSYDVKKSLKARFGERISFLENQSKHEKFCNIEDPNPFIEFFLLSMCPTVAFTAGGVFDGTFDGFSTFGYAAAVYGGKRMIGIDRSNSGYIM